MTESYYLLFVINPNTKEWSFQIYYLYPQETAVTSSNQNCNVWLYNYPVQAAGGSVSYYIHKPGKEDVLITTDELSSAEHLEDGVQFSAPLEEITNSDIIFPVFSD